jgi:magnesium transporter
MQRTVLRIEEPRFEWLDVVNPNRADFESLATARGLHPASVQDCLDPEHLPKFEKLTGITFVIVRATDEEADASAVTVQQLTRKVAIFLGPGFLISVHRKDQPFLLELQQAWSERKPTGTPQSEILVDLIGAAIRSYERPLDQAERVMDKFEEALFDGKRDGVGLEQIHVVKRRVTVIKRMLWQTLGVVQRLSPPSEGQAPWFQDLRENAESTYAWADEIFDNLNNLLMIQLSLASHRTNEVVRVLTIFSAFFLPLTFIVGVYGMNFDVMPELRWRLGYPAALAGMLLVCVAIYAWFRRNGWLR